MTMVMAARARSATRGEQPRYECRITRGLQLPQPELTEPLRLLAEHTSNYITYRNVGKVGVTIMMIEPLLRRIMVKNQRGVIPKDGLQTFETELRDRMSHAQFADYDIPLDSFNPLALRGANDDRLALQFDPKDYRMVGDRAMVEAYMRDSYDQADGRPVSKRFIDKHSHRLLPHITIGDVHYENMTREQRDRFQEDPTAFLVTEAYHKMEWNQKEYGTSACESEQIVFPETVSLNGLSVFCQQKQ